MLCPVCMKNMQHVLTNTGSVKHGCCLLRLTNSENTPVQVEELSAPNRYTIPC
jgi:hypothetical protein